MAMPVSKIRSGCKPLLRLTNKMAASVVMAAAMPHSHTCTPALMPSNTATNTPAAVPALMPSNSGLASGFNVMRCKITPAVASMMPAAAAINKRG